MKTPLLTRDGRIDRRPEIAAQVRAAQAYVPEHGPVPQDALNMRGQRCALWYDAVSLSVDTNTEWYAGLSNDAIDRGMRAIHRTLTARPLVDPDGD